MSETALTPSQILAIPLTEPERLFPNALDKARDRFRALALLWHPDRNRDPQAPAVMAHLTALHQAVTVKIKRGTWEAFGHYIFRGEGKTRSLAYHTKHSFELGEMLISQQLVTFVISKTHTDHILRGLRAIGSIRYLDPKWEKDLAQYIPRVEKSFTDTIRDADVLIIHKDADTVLLSDLLRHLGGTLDPKHVAWIISSLLNLCCFLATNTMTHNGLSVDTVFVSPKHHSVYLLGGWWYAVKYDREIKFVPKRTYALMTSRERLAKKATPRIDLECVKEIGRTCIGDLSALPKPFADFLRMPAPSSALKTYAEWEKVLVDSYGARRFIKLDVSPSAVYGG